MFGEAPRIKPCRVVNFAGVVFWMPSAKFNKK